MSADRYDTVIAGSGISGSLLALMLASEGRKVLLLEKGRHPRFSIGESATPVADLLLRRFSDRYRLDWLKDFSRYGSWRERHADIACGRKRGFSFYEHRTGQAFRCDPRHSNELLVAASNSDSHSDTNWFRSDFDAYLAKQVQAAGIAFLEACEIRSLSRSADWELQLQDPSGERTLRADFLVDASGSGSLSTGLLGARESSASFLTHSMAVYSHFQQVPFWMDTLLARGASVEDYPYDPDHSALHHLLEDGWMWVLRFDHGLTSMGLLLDPRKESRLSPSPEALWKNTLSRYPDLEALYGQLPLAPEPGRLLKTGRLQRRLDRCSGPGWAALPHAAGFVDPMFSPGIAHTLSGLDRLATILLHPHSNASLRQQQLQAYESKVFRELAFLDRLIAGCYQCLGHFELFNAWSMLYFAATIAHESRLLKGASPELFLEADDAALCAAVQEAYQELQKVLRQPGPASIALFTERMRLRIAPYQSAGLLDPSLHNMYAHTAAAI